MQTTPTRHLAAFAFAALVMLGGARTALAQDIVNYGVQPATMPIYIAKAMGLLEPIEKKHNIKIEFRSFAGLFARNRAAIEALVRPPSPVEGLVDELRHVRYELEVERTAPGTPDAVKVLALEARVTELENEVRRVVLGDVASAAAPVPSAPAPAPAPGEEKR